GAVVHLRHHRGDRISPDPAAERTQRTRYQGIAFVAMSPHRSDPELLVLHTLRLKGFVDADVVAHACRLPDDAVDATLRRLAASGLVTRRDGRISGWSLTAAGRAAGEQRLREELDAVGCR